MGSWARGCSPTSPCYLLPTQLPLWAPTSHTSAPSLPLCNSALAVRRCFLRSGMAVPGIRHHGQCAPCNPAPMHCCRTQRCAIASSCCQQGSAHAGSGIELGRQSAGPCTVVWPRCPALPASKHCDTDIPCSPHPQPRAARGKRPPANFPRPTNFGAGRRPQRFLLATLPLAAIPALTLRAAAGVGTSLPVLCHRAQCLMSPSLGVPCTILACFCSQALADAKMGHGWVLRCSRSLLHLRKQSWIRRMGPQEQGLAQR